MPAQFVPNQRSSFQAKTLPLVSSPSLPPHKLGSVPISKPFLSHMVADGSSCLERCNASSPSGQHHYRHQHAMGPVLRQQLCYAAMLPRPCSSTTRLIYTSHRASMHHVTRKVQRSSHPFARFAHDAHTRFSRKLKYHFCCSKFLLLLLTDVCQPYASSSSHFQLSISQF